MPQAMTMHSLVPAPDLDSVLAVGGLLNATAIHDEIYQLTCEPDNSGNCNWSLLSNLANPRYKMVASMIPNELVACQSSRKFK